MEWPDKGTLINVTSFSKWYTIVEGWYFEESSDATHAQEKQLQQAKVTLIWLYISPHKQTQTQLHLRYGTLFNADYVSLQVKMDRPNQSTAKYFNIPFIFYFLLVLKT